MVGCSDVSAVRGLHKERCDERARHQSTRFTTEESQMTNNNDDNDNDDDGDATRNNNSN